MHKYFLLGITVTFIAICTNEASADVPVLTHVIFRHGERTPEKMCATDPNKKEPWTQPFGQLTFNGIEEQYNLGKRLHQRYVKEFELLSPQFNHDEIYVRSTKVDRTIASAKANMGGLFANESVAEFLERIRPNKMHANKAMRDELFSLPGMQMFAVDSIEQADDFMFQSTRTCAERRNFLLKTLLKETPQYKEWNEKYREFMRTLNEHCGNLRSIGFFRYEHKELEATLDLEERHEKQLPKWATPEFRRTLHELNAKYCSSSFGLGIHPYRGIDFKKELLKIGAGEFLTQITEQMLLKRQCIKQQNQKEESASSKTASECAEMSQRRMFVYSAHDHNLASILASFGLKTNVDRELLPHCASAILIELWQRRHLPRTKQQPKRPGSIREEMRDNDFYLKVIYWPGAHDDQSEGKEMDLTGRITGQLSGNENSNRSLSLNAFKELVSEYKPPGEKLCKDPEDLYKILEKHTIEEPGVGHSKSDAKEKKIRIE